MKRRTLKAVLFLGLALGLSLAASNIRADAVWTNLNSGLWRDAANWRNGALPGGASAGRTHLTNANTKTISIDALTPATNLIINRIDITGRSGATNTLLLQDMGTNNPLIIANNLFSIYRGGVVQITNSALVVTGQLAEFNMWMGEVTLESGLILVREEPVTSNVTVKARVGRTNVAVLTINGGLFESSRLQIGETPNPGLGLSHGTVRLRGGQLKVHSELSIGDSASCTGIVEVTGGELTIPNNQTNITRVGDLGFGVLRVTNATAFLNNVSVARHDGSIGLLLIQSNAMVGCSDDISIGRFSGSSGTVLLEGGHLAVTNDAIWVGREGHGQLIISNGMVEAESLHVAIVPTNTASGTFRIAGGTLLVCSNFCLGDEQLSVGQVLMTGGDFSVMNDGQTAYSSVPSGTMTINGGMFTTDHLFLTNSTGHIAFNGGIVRTRGTTVSNGAPFVVGNGAQPANLHLLGGTHFFANGLVISSNATLTGCGVVIGTITNRGTIATNCAGMPPNISQQPSSQTVTQGATALFSVVASGDPPLHYQWQLGGLTIPDATNSMFTIAKAQPTNGGNYQVVVSNMSGSVTSVVATLKVLVQPALTNAVLVGTNLSFSFQSVTGLSYTIEYKTNLTDAAWIPLRTETGNGSLFTITDNVTAAASRFYRIRVE
jgi:T5SS/PEP-CTERM-associated repeat protein